MLVVTLPVGSVLIGAVVLAVGVGYRYWRLTRADGGGAGLTE